MTTGEAPGLHMPEAEAEAVRAAYRSAARIIEYGTGGSTLFAATETRATLLGIESDGAWVARLEGWLDAAGGRRAGITLRHIDIGPVRSWGMPKDSSGFRHYPGYPLSPWVDPAPGLDPASEPPDLVFIDGRFRLACFAATVLNATAPLTILWDDYLDRTGYHRAEALAGPPEMIGRMARFSWVPRNLTRHEINMVIPWFVLPG